MTPEQATIEGRMLVISALLQQMITEHLVLAADKQLEMAILTKNVQAALATAPEDIARSGSEYLQVLLRTCEQNTAFHFSFYQIDCEQCN